jgi:hypothetical protein
VGQLGLPTTIADPWISKPLRGVGPIHFLRDVWAKRSVLTVLFDDIEDTLPMIGQLVHWRRRKLIVKETLQFPLTRF